VCDALLAGVPSKVVQERLGHKKIGTTLDPYAHVLPSIQRDAARQLAALLIASNQVGSQMVSKRATETKNLAVFLGVLSTGAEGGSLQAPVRRVLTSSCLSRLSSISSVFRYVFVLRCAALYWPVGDQPVIRHRSPFHLSRFSCVQSSSTVSPSSVSFHSRRQRSEIAGTMSTSAAWSIRAHKRYRALPRGCFARGAISRSLRTGEDKWRVVRRAACVRFVADGREQWRVRFRCSSSAMAKQPTHEKTIRGKSNRNTSGLRRWRTGPAERRREQGHA
jgi:hypothetical protein